MPIAIPSSVSEAILEKFALGRPILGSSLGTLIYAHWSGLTKALFKQEFGSLGAFLELVDSSIVPVGPNGADTLYQSGARWPKAAQLEQPARSTNEKFYWRLFTNPQLTGTLSFKKGELAGGDLNSGWSKVDRMSLADNLSIIETFTASRVAQVDQEWFEKCLQVGD